MQKYTSCNSESIVYSFSVNICTFLNAIERKEKIYFLSYSLQLQTPHFILRRTAFSLVAKTRLRVYGLHKHVQVKSLLIGFSYWIGTYITCNIDDFLVRLLNRKLHEWFYWFSVVTYIFACKTIKLFNLLFADVRPYRGIDL